MYRESTPLAASPTQGMGRGKRQVRKAARKSKRCARKVRGICAAFGNVFIKYKRLWLLYQITHSLEETLQVSL